MDDARALLDSLMGPSRDKSAKEQQRGDGWKESNVCKRYLVGFCPNSAQDNWFHNTRRKDMGVCCKVHSDRLKDDFEKHPEHDRYELEYEKEFLDFLEGIVREADAWISREKGNCSGPKKVTNVTPELRQKMLDMQEQSEKLMQQAEDLAEKGLVDASKKAVELSGRMKEDIAELKEKNTVMTEGDMVCEICGVRCKPDERFDFQAHPNGKLHQGYTTIRAKVKELREKMRNRPAAPRRDDRDRDRDRDRARDRDRPREGRSEQGAEEANAAGAKEEREKAGEERRSRSRRRDRERGSRRDRDGSRERSRDRRSRDRRGRDRRGR